MGFYSRAVFPWLCELSLSGPFVAEQRQKLLAGAQGNVLEIGFGTGLNLPYYPDRVREISAVDPNPGMRRLAHKRIERTSISVHYHLSSGERLPFGDRTFDCVVSTFTLCSIDAVEQSVSEIFRVLKPGGQFLFLEHGLSREPAVQKWQRRLNWLQMRLANGCRLDRDVRQLVAAQPFSSISIDEFYLERSPKTHGYLYRGVARR